MRLGSFFFLASRVVSPPNPPSPGWLGPAPFMSCERVLRIGRVSGRFMSAVLYLSQSHVRIDRLFCFLVCFGFVEIPADSLMTIEELVRNEIELALMALGSLPWAEHQWHVLPVTRCPLWVISGHQNADQGCPP